MIDQLELISKLNMRCKWLFLKPFQLKLSRRTSSMSVYLIEGTSNALNRFDDAGIVRVLNWFDDYWLYVEIKFIQKSILENRNVKTQEQCAISISVYKGRSDDDIKHQLFRAEWDDNDNINEKHSQPHWHMTSNLAIEKSLRDYSLEFDNNEFSKVLDSVKKEFKDINRIHLAMAGNWQDKRSHIHKIDNEDKVINWFTGLIDHIKTELED